MSQHIEHSNDISPMTQQQQQQTIKFFVFFVVVEKLKKPKHCHHKLKFLKQLQLTTTTPQRRPLVKEAAVCSISLKLEASTAAVSLASTSCSCFSIFILVTLPLGRFHSGQLEREKHVC
ncbi:putative glucans biosynthesis glucosyltransferase H [Trichinella spiralis]|uniref:putative glucans biosynthesis glucosyltransferase H n=1 Tax=Trichinella spiralis TaxID=6334 RepID=UPI0001EFBF31|nr:putative glucans biosynthesis glucosyltransferase H [Trichinella spiralis]